MRSGFLLIAALTLVGCSEDGSLDPGPVPVLTLSEDSVSLLVGSTRAVTATVSNSTATPAFASRDENVARVSATGTITGIAVGTTYVVSFLPNLPDVRDSVRVRVSQTPSGQLMTLPLLGTGVVSERYTAEVAASGTAAYTTTWSSRNGVVGNAIKVWNVAGNTPVLVDSLIIQGIGTVSDIQISDNGALLVASLEGGTGTGLAIYDRSNALKPALISRFNTQSTHTVKLGRIAGKLYAFLSSSFGGRLTIVDLSDPANPAQVFSQPIAQSIHDVFIRDGVLFTAIWDQGMRIYDVGGAGRGGSPSAPVALGTVVTAHCSTCAPGQPRVHNIWWFHYPTTGQKKYAFVGEEGPSSFGTLSRGAMHVVDVSNFDNPREVAVFEPDPATSATGQVAGAHNFVMDEPSGIL